MTTLTYVLILMLYCCGTGPDGKQPARLLSTTSGLTEANCFSRGLTHVQKETARHGWFLCYPREPSK